MLDVRVIQTDGDLNLIKYVECGLLHLESRTLHVHNTFCGVSKVLDRKIPRL